MSTDLHKLVVSEHLAWRLKKASIPQESLFYYVRSKTTKLRDKPMAGIIYRDFIGPDLLEQCDDYCSAYTAGELAVFVKGWFDLHKKNEKYPNEWNLYFQPERGTDNSYNFTDNRLAEVLGSMLVAQFLEGELKI